MITEREILRRIERRDLNVGPLRVRGVVRNVAPSDVMRADAAIELEWDKNSYRFVVECKSTATPKQLRSAIAQVQKYVRGHSPDYPMVVVPYLSRDAIDTLIQKEVSGIDLSGSYAIIIPGRWFVVRADQPNQFPASRPIKKIYQGTSSLVGRVLLSVPELDLVKEVRQEIEGRGGSISIGTVSKVLKSLEEDLIVQRDPAIRLLQPKRLLDNLAENYERPTLRQQQTGKSRLDSSFFVGLLQNAGRNGYRVAGRSESHYTLSGVSDRRLVIYTTGLDGLTRGLDFEETSRFANVEILEIGDDTAFFNARDGEDGFRWCSPLQIYLELMNGGKRERETARQIREDLLEAVNGKLVH